MPGPAAVVAQPPQGHGERGTAALGLDDHGHDLVRRTLDGPRPCVQHLGERLGAVESRERGSQRTRRLTIVRVRRGALGHDLHRLANMQPRCQAQADGHHQVVDLGFEPAEAPTPTPASDDPSREPREHERDAPPRVGREHQAHRGPAAATVVPMRIQQESSARQGHRAWAR